MLTNQSHCYLYNPYYEFQELTVLSLRREPCIRLLKTHLTIFIAMVENVRQLTDKTAASPSSSSIFWVFEKIMPKERRKGFNTANQALQINKQFTKMRQAEERMSHQPGRPCLPKWLDTPSCPSASILLPTIKDQQIYLSIMSTFLTLARQADAPLEALQQVANAVFSAKGFEDSNMLRNLKQDQEQYRANLQPYNSFEKGCSVKQMKNLLEKIEKEMIEARQRQKQYRCLQKYRREKQEQIAPSFSSSSTSKKERFKRIVQNKYSKKSIQSSNFYQFDVGQILQNTFKTENECYKTMSSFVHLKTMFGHSADQDIESYSPIYNAIFDQSENLILTSGEEGLIKVWHRGSGTLIRNLKGHTDFINKIEASKCNKYLLSCGGDGIRFFDLKTLKPLGGWKTSSIEQIVSFIDENGKTVFLFGENSQLYLLTEEVMLAKSNEILTINDFMIFSFNESVGKENAAIIVISISPQKTHIIIGLETGQFLFINMSTLQEIMVTGIPEQKLILPALDPIKAHYQQIIQIKWSNSDSLWATGSKDGRCLIWELKTEQVCLVNTLAVHRGQRGRKKRNFSCTYICWNCTYSHFAAGFQENVDEQDTQRGQGEVLVYSMKEKKVTYEFSRDISLTVGGIRAMDAHPSYPNILLICESEGHIVLFDLFLGCIVNVFEERGYHILHPQFSLVPTECRFTKDGLSFIVSSQYGSVSLYGYDSKMFYALSPSEQFLETDFTEIRIDDNTMKAIPLTLQFADDINNYPLDSICTIKGQPYANIIHINCEQFLYSINNPLPVRYHFPQIRLDDEFLMKISFSIREGALLDLSYQKTYEEIQSNKHIILFHERERQFAKITSLTSDKVNHLKASQNIVVQHQNNAAISDEEPLVQTRKLKRHAQLERVNYVDDFSYHDSQQEDFDVIEQQLPDELEQDESESQPQMEQPRFRRRQRTRIRRRTRQSNPLRHNQQQIMESNQQRMPTRSRNHPPRQHRYQVDQISESVPKKRIKNNDEEESQQPKKYSRLRKQAPQEEMLEPIDCYRCQYVKAVQFCDKCTFGQQYCYECSLMRGRRIKDKYKCLICLFLQNDVPEEHQHVNQNIYRSVSRNKQSYLPQIEDEVRFFFQGYEQLLIQNVDKLNNSIVKSNQEFRLLPHTQDLRLLNTPLCKVKTIDYYFPVKGQLTSTIKRNPGKGEPLPILMLIGLILVQKAEEKIEKKIQQIEDEIQKIEKSEQKPSKEEQSIFWVYFIPGNEFLLPQNIYSQIISKNVLHKFQSNQLIQIKDEQMQIVEISPCEDRYPQSIWKQIKIRKTQGKRLRANTKDIEKRVNIWKVSEQIELLQPTTRLEEKHVEKLINQIQRWICEDSPYCLFVDYVDFEIYPLYRNHIPVGICLQTILARLKNNYYVGYESLKADFDRIYTNCQTFNGLSHQITEKARQLRKILHSLITDENYEPPAQIQPQNISKKTQEDSNSKKEKKKKDSEDYIDPSYQLTSKRKTRRGQFARTKKRRDSSEYNESEMSFDQQMGVRTRGVRNKTHLDEPKRITRSRAKN